MEANWGNLFARAKATVATVADSIAESLTVEHEAPTAEQQQHQRAPAPASGGGGSGPSTSGGAASDVFDRVKLTLDRVKSSALNSYQGSVAAAAARGAAEGDGPRIGPPPDILDRIKQELGASVINLHKLRSLAIYGVPDRDLRTIVWKLLLGYLPPSPEEWPATLAQRRTQYRVFCDELMLCKTRVSTGEPRWQAEERLAAEAAHKEEKAAAAAAAGAAAGAAGAAGAGAAAAASAAGADAAASAGADAGASSSGAGGADTAAGAAANATGAAAIAADADAGADAGASSSGAVTAAGAATNAAGAAAADAAADAASGSGADAASGSGAAGAAAAPAPTAAPAAPAADAAAAAAARQHHSRGGGGDRHPPPTYPPIRSCSQLECKDVTDADHPLSVEQGSEWNTFFQDSEVMLQVERDVLRTQPTMEFFTGETPEAETHREELKRCLFMYAKLNPGLRYIQGMNELIAPLYYLFRNDSDDQARQDAEADTFWCFMELISESRDHFCAALDNTSSGIKATLARLMVMLRHHDEALWRHVEVTCQVDPQFYAFRWVTLLLSQEFALQDIYRIWDMILSDPRGRSDCLLRVCTAMVLHVRDILMKGDFTVIMKTLQRFPPVDINVILHKASLLPPLPDDH
ncbi:hypothetical protein FOA52_001836 [Chlamydomonas sp. UWO 241]|nr:hypothetical protein FOA52_001836 [Chlamydomonas sp. UWO 241]